MSEASGRIVADNGQDRRGDTLATATLSGDAEIAVEDATDFDTEESDRRWLVIADSAPIAYTDVDDETDTITLVGTVGAAYEAGLPVDLWDPTVKPNGAPVVDHKVTVDLENGPHPGVTLRHEHIPAAGVDNLIGASVTIEDNGADEDWEVAKVHGRETKLDPASIGSPLFQAHLPVDGGRAGGLSIPDSTTTTVNDWDVAAAYDPSEFSFDAATGVLTLHRPGDYTSVVILKWAASTTGRREATILSTTSGVNKDEVSPVDGPPNNGVVSQVVPLLLTTTEPDVELRVQVWQNSTLALALRGDAAGTFSTWRIRRDR
jgi:hypothetical protein